MQQPCNARFLSDTSLRINDNELTLYIWIVWLQLVLQVLQTYTSSQLYCLAQVRYCTVAKAYCEFREDGGWKASWRWHVENMFLHLSSSTAQLRIHADTIWWVRMFELEMNTRADNNDRSSRYSEYPWYPPGTIWSIVDMPPQSSNPSLESRAIWNALADAYKEDVKTLQPEDRVWDHMTEQWHTDDENLNTLTRKMTSVYPNPKV